MDADGNQLLKSATPSQASWTAMAEQQFFETWPA
jgi:hypothetical protein